ncbi:protein-disulfide reductase DsbD [Janthinobacterium lividum]|uniref:protein-disulfide reductase DsbD n=1 Tax=Janthinobacterium lividum TaxID=29581 RepID=UPI0008941ADF|nr:protein-disulfide reductase DsbD [Janthinobacterium lividum]MCC7715545.1 protein-disulfide reductase DsbD [Janthinobacterium lividum]OEZ52125.1 thiol:disulfide interchange protein DsbD precursor [Janthinobacterium lividum]WQE29462.1 protein-disulfide reductase DsbD [Janthinobacterium lividum]STQ94941.1 Thiol:disulfide interchange protein DsbD precursor [Janthinobacterium lividum]
MSRFPSSATARAAPLHQLLIWFATCLLLAMAVFGAGQARADDEFLDPELAFKFSARMQDPATIAVTYVIADGYYMYHERFKFEAVGAKLGTPVYPAGKVKFDDTFQKNVETFRKTLTITIPVEAAGPFTLKATGQGCSDKGLCYAPQDATAQLVGGGGGQSMAPGGLPSKFALPAAPAVDTAAVNGPQAQASPGVSVMSIPQADITSTPEPVAAAPVAASPAPAQSEMGKIEAALKGGKLLVIVPLFMLLGLGLAFTPCVLPMVPILSSIIIGDGGKVSRSRGLLLSLTYALGMAIVYTALGVAAGLAGEGLAAQLQNPWVLGFFALLMAGLALSMFGLYELQVPAFLQGKLTSVSNQQSSGRLAGVFVMGAISALIVGPCVAAPLAGALLYISQTRDVVIGGSALFAMAVGMSVPLLLVGVSAGTLLPRAGAWMDAVKRFFGVLQLGVAWWLVSPVLPGAVQMLGWMVLFVGYGMYLLVGKSGAKNAWVAKAFGLVFALLGAMQLVGVASGGRDPLAPLAHLGGGQVHAQPFTRVKTVAQLDAALAQLNGKPALLDFYADWCVSCIEMEKLTFVDPSVREKMGQAVLLQVDVTANDADDKAMLKRFQLFGPPGIIMFNQQGQEIAQSRVIGFQNAATFLASLRKLDE